MEVRVTGKVGATGRVRSRDGSKSQAGRWRCATAVAVAVIVVVTAAVVERPGSDSWRMGNGKAKDDTRLIRWYVAE